MSFELKFTPLLGREESYVTLPKSQLIEACDAIIAVYTKRREELREDSMHYPFLDQEGGILSTPWGKRDEFVTVKLLPTEQKAFGVLYDVMTIAALKRLAQPVNLKSAKAFFKDVWTDIRYPHRRLDAPLLAALSERHDESPWDALIKQYTAVVKDSNLKENIISLIDLKEAVNANPNEKFIIGREVGQSLNTLLNAISRFDGWSEYGVVSIVQLFEGIIDSQRQVEIQAHIYEDAIFRDDPLRKEDFEIRKPKPPDTSL